MKDRSQDGSNIKNTVGKTSIIDNIIERGRKAVNMINSNLYGDDVLPKQTQVLTSYRNPFASDKLDRGANIDNTLDRINLLEYSHESKLTVKETETITDEESSLDKINDFDLKNYDNFILKIEDLVMIDETILKNRKDNPLYLECRVPLLKNESHNAHNEILSNPNNNLFFDTFKIFNKIPANDNVYKLNHISYHKMNLTESNISTLMNSKIELFLHFINVKNNNEDIIIGKSEVEFNKIIMSKDFFFNKIIEIFNVKNEKKKSEAVQDEKKNQPKSKNVKQTKNVKDTKKVFSDDLPRSEIPYKIAEVEISCQLYRSQGREIGKKQNKLDQNYYKLNENNVIENDKVQNNDEQVSNNQVLNKEVEVDFEEILTLLVNVQSLKPMTDKKNENFFDKEKNDYNFYLSHKIFPKTEVNKSEILWNNKTPNFEYLFTMPFTMNQRVIEMMENFPFMVELWNRNFDQDDELMGTVKLDMTPILESLKISENVISIVPISKNLLPLIIHDEFAPVYNYDYNANIAFLYISLGLGTSTQINNYMKKIHFQNTQKKEAEVVTKKTQPQASVPVLKHSHDFQNTKDDNINLNITKENKNEFKNTSPRKGLPDEEEDDIVKMLNNNKTNTVDNNLNKQRPISQNHFLELDNYENIDKILEQNKEYIKDRIYKEYKDSDLNFNKNFVNSQFETKYISNHNYENPFINSIKKSSNFEIIEQKKKALEIGNPNNFMINSIVKSRPNDLKISSGHHDQFIEKNDRKDIISDKEIPELNNRKNNFLESNNNSIISNVGFKKELKIPKEDLDIKEALKTTENPYKQEQRIPEINKNILSSVESKMGVMSQSENQKFVFDINLERVVNIPILKSIEKPYIKHKFFSDCEEVKSEVLVAGEGGNSSTNTGGYDIDMKTSHSIVLPNIEKIKNYISDFHIKLYYKDRFDEEVLIGKAILPVDDLNDLIFDNSFKDSSEINRVIFIYGTEKINRDGSVIGKLRLQIKFNKNFVSQSNNEENLLLEKQLIYNRKIPKSACLNIRINYFKYESSFLHHFDMKNYCYFFSLDPFAEDKILKKNFHKKFTKSKYNSLNGVFDQSFNYPLKIEGQVLEYLKTKNFVLYLNTKKSQAENSLQNSFSSNESETDITNLTQIGICKIPLCEMLSVFDKITNYYPVFSTNDSSIVLGYIYLDIGLESGTEEIENEQQQRKIEKNNKREKGLNAVSSLSDLLIKKKQENLDGKYYFTLKIVHLIYNNDFLNRLDKQFKLNPQNKEKTIFFMYKIGKSIKKVSHFFDLSQVDSNIFDYFNMLNIFFHEIIELSFNFSKNKPQDILNQFMEGVLEIKLYLKTEEDNINIGSFMIDLSLLFSSNCRVSGALQTASTLISYYDNQTKKVDELLRISVKLALIRSDLNTKEFKDFYYNLDSIINNTVKFQSIITNVFSPSNSENLENSKKFLAELFTENHYNYIDTYLVSLDDSQQDEFLRDLGKVLSIFSNNTFFHDYHSIFSEHVEILSKRESIQMIENGFKIKKFMNSNYKLKFDSYNLWEVFENKSNIKDLLKKFAEIYTIIHSNQCSFDVYSKKDNEDGNCEIDLINLFYFMFSMKLIYGFDEDEKENQYHNLKESEYIKTITNKFTQDFKVRYIQITVKSAMRLVSESPEKYNPYFTVKWGDNTYHSSEVIMKSSYPAWNDSFKFPINEKKDLHLIKGNVPIQFILNTRNINSMYSYNNFEQEDNYVGECTIFLNELMKSVSNTGEFEGYFHITNKTNNIKGQFNIKFILEQELIDCLAANMNNPSTSNLNFYLTKNFFEDKKCDNFSFQTSLKATNFDFNNNFLNCKLTSEDLWKNLNQNIEDINNMTRNIDIETSNVLKKNDEHKPKSSQVLYSTIERERRITDKGDSDKHKNSNSIENSMMSLQMDLENPVMIQGFGNLNNSKKKVQSLEVESNSPINKKPPIPVNIVKEKLLNMTIDQKELTRIREIIKDKDKKKKKNTFYSSDESN